MTGRKEGALLPLLGLASALAIASWLAWSLFGRSSSLAFPVLTGADYEAIVFTGGSDPREVYRIAVRDQDAGDRDRRPGWYRLRVPNPRGLPLEVRPRQLTEGRARSGGEPKSLPAALTGTPFAGEAPRRWVPFVEMTDLIATFQHTPGSWRRGRAVEFSEEAGEIVLTPECDVTLVDVDEAGQRALLVREQPSRLEIWQRGEDGAWDRVAALEVPESRAVSGRWDDGRVWFVATRGMETALWQWEPAAAEPQRQVELSTFYQLLTVQAEQVWLAGLFDGEFLRYAPGAGLQSFAADPTLGAALRSYHRAQDAFLYLLPARDRRGLRLLRRGRLDRQAELLRILPEETLAVSLSVTGRLVGVQRCR